MHTDRHILNTHNLFHQHSPHFHPPLPNCSKTYVLLGHRNGGFAQWWYAAQGRKPSQGKGRGRTWSEFHVWTPGAPVMHIQSAHLGCRPTWGPGCKVHVYVFLCRVSMLACACVCLLMYVVACVCVHACMYNTSACTYRMAHMLLLACCIMKSTLRAQVCDSIASTLYIKQSGSYKVFEAILSTSVELWGKTCVSLQFLANTRARPRNADTDIPAAHAEHRLAISIRYCAVHTRKTPANESLKLG